jgi:hypothetical protein
MTTSIRTLYLFKEYDTGSWFTTRFVGIRQVYLSDEKADDMRRILNKNTEKGCKYRILSNKALNDNEVVSINS